MITIKEAKTKKVVGETSLFLNAPYRPEYVAFLKTLSGVNMSKKTKTWEIPLSYLAQVIDELCIYDNISISLLKDSKLNIIDNNQDNIKLSKYKTQIFEHQKEGIKFGLTHSKFLLLDEPGLGKSLTSLYVALELKKRAKIQHCLIICGINSLKENWRREIEKHTDLSCTILGERVTRSGRRKIGGVQDRVNHLKRKIDEFFVITNIETLRDDKIVKEINKGKNQFDLIICDEVHACKSATSAQGKNLLKLNKAPYKIAMTGTLLLNNPLDTYVPLKWIDVERSTYSNFRYYYCKYGGKFHNLLIGFKNIKLLKDTLEKYSLRRTKDLLNLPPKIVVNEYVEMDSSQEIFYENIKQGIKDQVDKVRLSTANLLALTARLRQATACPSILTTENIPSAKLDRACSLVEEITSNGSKVLIFSTFKDSVYELEKRLQVYKPLIATGDIADETVNERVIQFQNNPENKVFICTWQKCGTGLTLTAANYEIFIDTPWTDAVYTQAQDRCHRIGTKDTVTIYNLITTDTIDERVLEILEDKSALAAYIVDSEISEKGLKSLKKYIEDL